ncbi:diacylglycerol/lipid kinase family protein [Pseudoalteromonas luteoviolacea]|uniref:diacylglycerol/lipid kinase family protein n=1 Tax=Pseudoalteromonas luteoviolacea TaxID=43657 RepID=UPI00114F7754|nr:YegS/Rv2252/BmrU family lipid kinase [Pseudoalteromonas luteoviolacea]TQF72670.1 YegS/Rv2252/BmrU family lipid kinase [Pseudoalteromonas luteoviolacea]
MLVVYRPQQGKKCLAHIKWLKSQAQDRSIQLYWYETTGHFEADLERLKCLVSRYTQVIVLGGDGTLNLAINAIAGTEVALSLLPCGTGNDFSRQFGYSTRQWRNTVFAGRTRHIDVGQVDKRFFINIAGVGFNAEVVSTMGGKKPFGKLSYTFAGLLKLALYRGTQVEFGLGSMPTMMCLFSNGRHFAAGLTPAPQAQLDDGLLEVITIPAVSWYKRFWCFALMLFGQHTRLSWVSVRRCQQIEIKTPGLAIEADGDLIATTPAKVKCRAALLQFKVLN